MAIVKSRKTTSAGARINRYNLWSLAKSMDRLRKQAAKRRKRNKKRDRTPRPKPLRDTRDARKQAIAKVLTMPAPKPTIECE